MRRDENISSPLLAASSCACDVAGGMCALPCLVTASCCHCGPFDGAKAISGPAADGTRGRTDVWYRAAIHSLHGGSLLQLLATHSLFWRFPRAGPGPGGRGGREREADEMELDIVVEPRNVCGECFAPLVRRATPRFRVKKLSDDLWSVRLTSRNGKASGDSLNDVWRVSPDGRVITSMKTRSHHVPSCLTDGIVTGLASGPALFVAADPEPTLREIVAARRLQH